MDSAACMDTHTNAYTDAYAGEIALECFIGWCLDTAADRRRDHVRVWTLAHIARTCSRMRGLCLRVIERRSAVLTRQYGPRLLRAWWNRYLHGPGVSGHDRVVSTRARMSGVCMHGDDGTLGTPVWDPIQPIGSICATSRIIMECADGSPFSLICIGINNVVYDVVPVRARGRWWAITVAPWFPVPPASRARVCEDPDTGDSIQIGSIRIAIGLTHAHDSINAINRIRHMYVCMHDVKYWTHLSYAYNTAATTFVNYLHMTAQYRTHNHTVTCPQFRDRYLLAMMTARVGMQVYPGHAQQHTHVSEVVAARADAYVDRLAALQNRVANHAPLCRVCRGEDDDVDAIADGADALADTAEAPATDVDALANT